MKAIIHFFSKKAHRLLALMLILGGACLYVSEHVKHDYRVSRENRILNEEIGKLSSYIALLEKESNRIIAHEAELVKYKEQNSPEIIEGLRTIADIIHPRILLLKAAQDNNHKIDYESCKMVMDRFRHQAEHIFKNEEWAPHQKKYLTSVLLYEQTFFGAVCQNVEPPV